MGQRRQVPGASSGYSLGGDPGGDRQLFRGLRMSQDVGVREK